MPELPDVELYVDHIARRTVGRALSNVRLASPFLLRTVEPKVSATHGKKVLRVSRLGKRIVLSLEDEIAIVIHLMIAGRFRWADEPNAKIPGKLGLAAFDFAHGTLLMTEASTQKRASIHIVRGEPALRALDPGGVELFTCTLQIFSSRLREENHTVKRTLTDPTVFSGVGNAYSDEILWSAKLSPIKLTQKLTDEEIARLFNATREVLATWKERLAKDTGDTFPEKVTAFRPEMAVHGKFGKPCPRCQTPVQRIRYAANEANYCARCQTDGKLLADRSLSRLLKGDWPKSLEELEAKKRAARE